VTQGNNSATAQDEKGLQLAQAGDLASAEAELRQAVELAPDNATYLAGLGTVLAMQKKLEASTAERVWLSCRACSSCSTLVEGRWVVTGTPPIRFLAESYLNRRLRRPLGADPERIRQIVLASWKAS
jgi:predicted Zn-dependent protease